MRHPLLISSLALLLTATPITALAQANQKSADSEHVMMKAYKKEIAYLSAQKKELANRLAQLNKNNAKALEGLKTELSKLENQLLSMSVNADRLEENYNVALDQKENTPANDQIIATLFEQASASLERDQPAMDVAKASADELNSAVRGLFGDAIKQIQRQSSIRTEKGSFFLESGSKADGEITWVGEVAAFGKSSQGGGYLIPAGQGLLKVSTASQSGAFESFSNRKVGEPLSIFFFENVAKAIEERKEKTLTEFLDAGGTIAWVIVILGLVGLFLVFVRAIILMLAGSGSSATVDNVCTHLAKQDVKAATETAQKGKSVVSSVVARVLSHPKTDESVEEVIGEAILKEMPKTERFGAIILVFAAVAPLLGLLGTVTGMIATFDIITEYGTGDPRLLSGGISEALITTQLGLVVAIPLILLGNLLKSRANQLQSQMEEAALRVLNLMRSDEPATLAKELEA